MIKTLLITGASSGLGQQCAVFFEQQGYRIILASRSIEKLETIQSSFQNPSHHFALKLNLLEKASIPQAKEKVLKFIPFIDGMIHCAGGGLGLRNPLLTTEEINQLLAVNLTGAIALNQLFLPLMIEQKKGNIIHVGSTASSYAVGSVGYNTVKAALAAYVRSLGREMITHNVVVSGIMPGAFHGYHSAMDRLKENKPEVYAKWVREHLPDFVTPSHAFQFMPLMQLLISEQAHIFAGCMLPVDNGEGVTY